MSPSTNANGLNHNPSVISSLVDTLTSSKSTWENSPLLSVTQITPSGLTLLFETAIEMRNLVRTKGGDNRLAHKILATVFYEASTRTNCSFQSAMLRLGGQLIHVDGSPSGNSSAGKKGETLSDTIRCLQCYTDVIVLRHPVLGSVKEAILGTSSLSKTEKENGSTNGSINGNSISNGSVSCGKPILNAGDGVGEHPTQALLDLFTIHDELGLLPMGNKTTETLIPTESTHDGNLTIVLLGDLKHGRTVHSLAKLLARSNMKQTIILRYCSPPSLKMPQYVKDYVDSYGLKQEEFTDLMKAVDGANVLYVTRIQFERFENVELYNNVKGCYVVDKELMSKAPANMVVMHPLPRVGEIAEEVDSDPRAAYFRQMENGMFVRMALLALVLNKA